MLSGHCARAGPQKREEFAKEHRMGTSQQKDQLSSHTQSDRSQNCFREAQFCTLFKRFLVTEMESVGSESI